MPSFQCLLICSAQTKDNSAHLPKNLERKTKPTVLHGKENCLSSANQMNVHKINLKGIVHF